MSILGLHEIEYLVTIGLVPYLNPYLLIFGVMIEHHAVLHLIYAEDANYLAVKQEQPGI